MASYLIAIDESQREALAFLLASPAGAALVALDGPLEYWPEMVRDLPKEEAESPGVIHGFCL